MEREIKNSLAILSKGGTLIYPTDRFWGLGCDATNPEAKKNIYHGGLESKIRINLVPSSNRLKEIIPEFPEKILDLQKNTERPAVLICKNPQGLAKYMVARDNTTGNRWVKEAFCSTLIEANGKPIVYTSANVSGHADPTCFSDIPQSLLHKVDYVVNLHRDKKNQPSSSILQLNEAGEMEYLS